MRCQQVKAKLPDNLKADQQENLQQQQKAMETLTNTIRLVAEVGKERTKSIFQEDGSPNSFSFSDCKQKLTGYFQ